MKPLIHLFKICLILAIIISPNIIQAQFQIAKSVFGNGGGVTGDADNSILSSAGQPGINIAQNGNHQMHFGFWYGQQFLVGLEDIDPFLPTKFELFQNYPNPFNPVTKIKYAVPRASNVRLEIYNILGQRVRTLVNTEKSPGYYVIDFDGSNLASGFYIYRLETKEFSDIRKMMLIK